MKLPTHISYDLKKSFYLLSWKSLSCLKFLNLKYFPMKFKYFSKTLFHLIKWKKSCHLLSRVLYLKRIWIHGDHKCKNESLGKSFYSLSFNFQKFRISLTFSQSINQSKLSIYYNIPKFRILGCYKPSTLKKNLVLEIRRG